jgi:hypothetical protein
VTNQSLWTTAVETLLIPLDMTSLILLKEAVSKAFVWLPLPEAVENLIVKAPFVVAAVPVAET